MLHDLTYWAGGSIDARDSADRCLRTCVAATGETEIAEIMYLGVRLGHLSPESFHGQQWGHAWSETEKRTTPLATDEIEMLRQELLGSQYDTVLSQNDRLAFIQLLANPESCIANE